MNKNNKIIAWGLIVSFTLCVFGYAAGSDSSLTSIGGIGLWVFGIWSVVHLFKTADKKLAEEI